MSLIQRISTLRTLSFAVGVMLGLVSAVYAEPGTGQLPAHRPGSQLALDHGPTVARTGRQPTAAEINQRLAERGACAKRAAVARRGSRSAAALRRDHAPDASLAPPLGVTPLNNPAAPQV